MEEPAPKIGTSSARTPRIVVGELYRRIARMEQELKSNRRRNQKLKAARKKLEEERQSLREEHDVKADGVGELQLRLIAAQMLLENNKRFRDNVRLEIANLRRDEAVTLAACQVQECHLQTLTAVARKQIVDTESLLRVKDSCLNAAEGETKKLREVCSAAISTQAEAQQERQALERAESRYHFVTDSVREVVEAYQTRSSTAVNSPSGERRAATAPSGDVMRSPLGGGRTSILSL
jgi:chromosome segregation ATPase